MIKLTIGVLGTALIFAAAQPAAAQGKDKMTAMKAWKECMQNVRRDYPVPPGNMNELNQRIQNQCGPRPS